MGRTGAAALAAWPHVQLQPLSFEGLTFDSKAGDSATNLWVDLARAALAGTSAEEGDVDPSRIAQAIEEQHGEGYDRMVVAHLLQISKAMKAASGPSAAVLQRQTSNLIGALSPETLRRLVDMGGNLAAREAFIRDTTSVMAVDAVLDIVKAAADTSGRTISHSLVRMLSKLAAHAEFGDESARQVADGALREQVNQMVSGWQLADPNPEAYGRLLERLATSDQGASRDSSSQQPDPVRLVQISLEAGESGPLAVRAIARGIAQGRATELLALLLTAPDERSPAADALRERLLSPTTLRTLLQQPILDFDSLDRLLPFPSVDGYEVLLDALARSDSRAGRRKLLDRLSQAPLDLTALIVRRLEDDRWFIQRNMLVLLERTGRSPEGFSVKRWTAHPDVRVRHEAIRVQLTLPPERDLAVRAALEDGHPRLVHSGLAALQQDCPAGLTELVGQVATSATVGNDLRVLALRALGRSRDRRALPILIGLVDGGLTLFGRQKLAPRSPVMLAALQSLSLGWKSDARASEVLKLAVQDPDADIRQAAKAGDR